MSQLSPISAKVSPTQMPSCQMEVMSGRSSRHWYAHNKALLVKQQHTRAGQQGVCHCSYLRKGEKSYACL